MELLCLPCAGASATMYLRWRRLLPASLRIVPVELPGRGERTGEPFARGLDALVDQLCEELAGSGQVKQGRPYALFGHSMGALLAHGIARRLHARGQPLPRRLFVAGSPAPSRRNPRRFEGKETDAALIADLRAQGGTPEAVFESAELLRITLDTLAADYRVCATHVYREAAPLPVPVRAFGGRDDDISADDLLAWGQETSAGFSAEWFTGGHFFIRPHERTLIEDISQELRRAGELEPAHAV